MQISLQLDEISYKVFFEQTSNMTFRSNSLVIVCIVTLVLGKLQKVFAEKAPLDPENNQHQEMMEDSVALGNPFNYTSLHDTFVHFMAVFYYCFTNRRTLLAQKN